MCKCLLSLFCTQISHIHILWPICRSYSLFFRRRVLIFRKALAWTNFKTGYFEYKFCLSRLLIIAVFRTFLFADWELFIAVKLNAHVCLSFVYFFALFIYSFVYLSTLVIDVFISFEMMLIEKYIRFMV